MCIWVSQHSVNWSEADKQCRVKGANLLSIRNETMNQAVLEHLKNTTNSTTFYFGLHLFNRTFRWSDSGNSSYYNWSNGSDIAAAINQTSITFCAYYDSKTEWRVQTCNMSRRYVCQKSIGTPKTCTKRPALCGSPCMTPCFNNTEWCCNCRPVAWCWKDGVWGFTCVNDTKTLDCSKLLNNNKQGKASRKCVSKNGRIAWSVADTSGCYPLSSSPTPSDASTSGKSTEIRSDAIADAVRNELNAIKGRPLTDAESKQFMTKFAGELGNMVKSGGSGPPSTEQVGNVVKVAEEVGLVLVDGMKRSGNVTETKTIQVAAPGIDLGVSIVPSGEKSALQKTSKGMIRVPEEVLFRAEKSGITDGVGLTMSFLHTEAGNGSGLNSGVMSTTVQQVSGGLLQNLTDPVVITLTNTKDPPAGAQSSCVYLDAKKSPPVWSDYGCTVFSSNKTRTVCHCNHTTSFAVLMDVHGIHNGDEISDQHKFALMIVSLVGCGIALLCFVAALLAFHITVSDRHRRKTETMVIHKHLAIAEIFALVLFLVAYGAVSVHGLCYAVAVLLHYSLLAVFFWMLIEGFNLHRGLVKVFLTSSRIKAYCVLGWVTPAVIVAITAGVVRQDYLRDDFCWISYKYIWVFAGPVAAIVFINFIILIIAIRVLVRRSRYKISHMVENNMSEMEKELRIAFKTTVVLLPLLGLTWCLGFLAAHNTVGNIVIQYLFAVINSLQGLYFFIAHCLYDEDVIHSANRTSVRVKTMFRRTLSSNQSASTNTSRSNDSKRVSAYYNATGSPQSPAADFHKISPEHGKVELTKGTPSVSSSALPPTVSDKHMSLSAPDLGDIALNSMTCDRSNALNGTTCDRSNALNNTTCDRSNALNNTTCDTRSNTAIERMNSTESNDSVFHDRPGSGGTALSASMIPLTRSKTLPRASSTEKEHITKRIVQRVASADQCRVHCSDGSPPRSRTSSTTIAWESPQRSRSSTQRLHKQSSNETN